MAFTHTDFRPLSLPLTSLLHPTESRTVAPSNKATAWLNDLTDESLSDRELRAFNKLPIASNPEQEYPQGSGSRAPTPRHHSIWDFDSGLSEKIRRACEIAHRDGYRYIWINSGCIDKTSSSELSEAINSIFNWYRDAQVCYAFLSDVLSLEGNTSAFSDS